MRIVATKSHGRSVTSRMIAPTFSAIAPIARFSNPPAAKRLRKRASPLRRKSNCCRAFQRRHILEEERQNWPRAFSVQRLQTLNRLLQATRRLKRNIRLPAAPCRQNIRRKTRSIFQCQQAGHVSIGERLQVHRKLRPPSITAARRNNVVFPINQPSSRISKSRASRGEMNPARQRISGQMAYILLRLRPASSIPSLREQKIAAPGLAPNNLNPVS